jgi:hypothetical protein
VYLIDERMAEEMRGDAARLEIFQLEGEDNDQIVDIAAKLLHASLLPGPDLRGDIEDHGNSTLVQRGREAEIEAGIIDEDGEGWFSAYCFFDNRIEDSPEISIALHHFDKSDHIHIRGIDESLYSLLA